MVSLIATEPKPEKRERIAVPISDLFESLERLEAESRELVVKAIKECRIQPDYQLAFYDTVIGNTGLYEAIRKAAEGVEKPKYVDPCCGDGISTIVAAIAGCQAYGGDIDPEFIRIAKENVLEALGEGLFLGPDKLNPSRVAVNDMFDIHSYKRNLSVAFNEADIFFVNALPSQIEQYAPLFAEHARNGARIILPGKGKITQPNVKLLEARLTGELDEHGRPEYAYHIYQKQV